MPTSSLHLLRDITNFLINYVCMLTYNGKLRRGKSFVRSDATLKYDGTARDIRSRVIVSWLTLAAFSEAVTTV